MTDTVELDHTTRMKAVAAALGRTTRDDGGGHYVLIDDTGLNSVYAYALAPGDAPDGDPGTWRLLDDNSGTLLMSDLPLDADPDAVAAWVREQLPDLTR